MTATLMSETVEAKRDEVLDVEHTHCCIVGGGPAGAILALLLARRGVPVTLLEQHKDFDRQFRGDTLHPTVLEILDQLGLAGRLHELRHSKATGPTLQFADGPLTPFDLTRLKTRFPYVFMVPQKHFLEFITAEAGKYPAFRLVMGANVRKLVTENGVVRGVQYVAEDGWHELRAALVVGADGRFSQIRKLAGIVPKSTAPPMDVLWFRLPKLPGDSTLPGGVGGAIGRGRILIILDRADHWQSGLVFPKGLYQKLHEEGISAIRRTIGQIDPHFAPHAETLRDWHQLSLLSVEASCCEQWYQAGLLLIGDAAHAMSPIAGVGINYAIQDAVVTANVLGKALAAGRVTEAQLAEVQRQRAWPTRVIQRVQAFFQDNLMASATGNSGRAPWQMRLITRIPFLRDVPGKLFAFGARRVRIIEP